MEIKKTNKIECIDNFEIEEFKSQRYDDTGIIQEKSTCNIIVPVKLRFPLHNIEERNEFKRAKQNALNAINLLLYLNNEKENLPIRISDNYYFITDIENNIIQYNLNLFCNEEKIEFELKGQKSEFVKADLELIQKLDSDIELHQKIKIIFDKLIKFKLNDDNFDFLDIWIVWESLFDKNQFKKVCRLSIKKEFEVNFISDIILLFNSYLFQVFPEHNKSRILFSKNKLTKYGLNLEQFKSFHKRKFINNYEKLFKELDFPFLNLIKPQIDLFLNNRNEFNKNLDSWVDETIDEFYIERNTKARNNVNNPFSELKLKNNIIYILEHTIKRIVFNVNGKNKNNIHKIVQRIKSN